MYFIFTLKQKENTNKSENKNIVKLIYNNVQANERLLIIIISREKKTTIKIN